MADHAGRRGLKLREVAATDRTRISACARTLSRAFSADPLLVWLYRSQAKPWGDLDKKNQDWQELRIRKSTASGHVLALFPEDASAAEICTGLLIMFPGKSRASPKWSVMGSIGQQLARLGSWFVWEPTEQCCDPGRTTTMSKRHDQILDEHANGESIWYLEAIAIDPAYQGQGVGKVLMNALLERIGADDCVLECTAESTIPFYERFGFRTVQVVELVDEVDANRQTNLWVMKRSGSKETS